MLSAMLCGPHVLAIHLGDIDRLRLLRLVRMVPTGIDVKVAHLPAAQRTTRNHALDRLLDHALRKAALENFPSRTLLDMADIAGVLVIDLVVALAAGQHHMR